MSEKYTFLMLLLGIIGGNAVAQRSAISGEVSSKGEPLAYANVVLLGTTYGTISDTLGHFSLSDLRPGTYEVRVSYQGYLPRQQVVQLVDNEKLTLNVVLEVDPDHQLEEVVISGTMKAVKRVESPVPVEVYSPTFFKKNPTPNVFEALQQVNGVRPQLNCNVCNTGDIHINGLEGPYTMVLLDGMPIVSGLSTVYGLSGIPNSLIQRVEIVKGPASSLYGSEAVGGLINILTKSPTNAPKVSAEVFTTSWQEVNADVGLRLSIGEKVDVLTGLNLFVYDNPIDNNGDNFTDVTLQKRISLFQKWNIARQDNRLFTLAGRYFAEDRWGGEMQWTPAFRGGDSIYGESIRTQRWELMGNYELPVKEKLMLSFSMNGHHQDSYYGDMFYLGQQNIGFGQLTWDKRFGKHDLLGGLAMRYTYYDDNTTATAFENETTVVNQPETVWLPGIFIQDEIAFHPAHKLLLGLRYDQHSIHGGIVTPRLAYKWQISPQQIFRLNAGTGFRSVTLFTEDHAALTGAREVLITEALRPEESYNVNLNFLQKVFTPTGHAFNFELSAFYTYFTNQIVPDYDTDPNLIIYDNLEGYAVASGVSANIDIALANGWKFLAGGTLMNNFVEENGDRFIPVLNERFNGTWAVSYAFAKIPLTIDYTGNLYGPMRLPLLGELDPRDEFSPWWSLQNIQLTYTTSRQNWSIYGGVKNILNFTPPANSIARPFDPFDRQVQFGGDGQVIPTTNNPNALTFDPSYVYAPNQGFRVFLGLRWQWN